MATPILQRLREETAAAHSSLEARSSIEECLVDPSRYANLLENFYGFYAPMENLLETRTQWSGRQPELTDRRKAGWIAEDLSALGRDPAGVPMSSALPDIADEARAFGALYVLEGSTLGGRMITGMLQKSTIPENARRFFFGYGEETGPKWKDFCIALETYAGESGRGDDVVAGAIATFAGMEDWMHQTAATA